MAKQSPRIMEAPASGQRARSKGRGWLGRVAYCILLVAFVELSLSAFYRLTTGAFLFTRVAKPIYIEEPFGGWAVKPNLSYRHSTPEFTVDLFTNSQGFRTSRAHEEYAKGADPSRYRVLLLGPSFALGWGASHEQTFAAELQRFLERAEYAGDRKIEVINRGVPSLYPSGHLNWLKKVGKDWAPDLVIQFAYGSMQVARDTAKMRVIDGYLVPQDPTWFEWAAAYAKQSAIVYYAWVVAQRVRGQFGAPPPTIQGAGREMRAVSAFDPANGETAQSIAFYREFQATVDAIGARLLLVYFPLAYVVHPRDMPRWQHLGVQDVERQVAFDRAFADYLGNDGILCVNLTQELINHAQRSGQRLYNWLDIHWTPEGNRITARMVAEALIARPGWAKRSAGPQQTRTDLP